ncbi:MAG: DUF4065 domain-containing protein [Lachnospiraceae bacterium]|nr:DUF4065 domain-containing protein [Lachnospiraceae bacterium]
MEEHQVDVVSVIECTSFKKRKVEYEAQYFYCCNTNELYTDENQLQYNDISLKDAYRKAEGLLTSDEISNVRVAYDISQRDLCILLGWGEKTITRYESHQVQDRAHDAILKKIQDDTEWYLSLLTESKKNLAERAYQRYLKYAKLLYESKRDVYLRKAIEAEYIKYKDISALNGNVCLSLDKVIDIIRYFSTLSRVTRLYKVKLMNLLWYADALSYKMRGTAITGLVYLAMSMGALPIGHHSIINLDGVPCDEIDEGEGSTYFFYLDEAPVYEHLTKDDISILDIIIDNFGRMSKKQIVDRMHEEEAYRITPLGQEISFEYAKNLHTISNEREKGA